MKKEIVFVITAFLFVLAYFLDRISGPVNITIKNQFQFLDLSTLSLYPLTAFSILSRTIALVLSCTLLSSITEKNYFSKIAVFLFMGVLAQLYAWQQLVTGTRVIPTPWTLSIAFAGLCLILPIIGFLFSGISNLIKPQKPSNSSNDTLTNWPPIVNN